MISTPFSMAALAAPAWTDCQKIVVFPFGITAIVVLRSGLHARKKAGAASTSPRTAAAVFRIYSSRSSGRRWLDVPWIVSAGIGGDGQFGVQNATRALFLAASSIQCIRECAWRGTLARSAPALG